MSVIRRSRLAGIAGIVAMVMAVLSVCPCPEMATASSEDAHRCCAGKDALTVSPASPSCCLEEASDPQLADTSVTPPPTAGWAALHAIVSAAPAPPVLSPVSVSIPYVAAPPILRI